MIQTMTLKNQQKQRPTGESIASILLPVALAFKYTETSLINSGSSNVFVSFERTETIQNSNKRYFYIRFSAEAVKQLGT